MGYTMSEKKGQKREPRKRMRNVANFTALPRAGYIACFVDSAYFVDSDSKPLKAHFILFILES